MVKNILGIFAVSILVTGCSFLDENLNTKYSTEDTVSSASSVLAVWLSYSWQPTCHTAE